MRYTEHSVSICAELQWKIIDCVLRANIFDSTFKSRPQKLELTTSPYKQTRTMCNSTQAEVRS